MLFYGLSDGEYLCFCDVMVKYFNAKQLNKISDLKKLKDKNDDEN